MEESYQWVLENIRSIRKRKGILQSEVAKKAGLSNSQYSLLENGKQQPGIGILLRVAKALGVDTREFFHKEDEEDNSFEKKLRKLNQLSDKERQTIEAMIDIALQKKS